jgi:hypothetical protein
LIFSADQSTSHSARDEEAEENQGRGSDGNVGAPCQVRNEEQDINDKSGNADEEGDEVEDEESEQIL